MRRHRHPYKSDRTDLDKPDPINHPYKSEFHELKKGVTTVKKVFKYEIDMMDKVSIEMPIGAEVLHFDSQNGAGCIWALVDPDNEFEQRYFRIAGTGHAIEPQANESFNYVNTAMFPMGLVFHCFEVVV